MEGSHGFIFYGKKRERTQTNLILTLDLFQLQFNGKHKSDAFVP